MAQVNPKLEPAVPPKRRRSGKLTVVGKTRAKTGGAGVEFAMSPKGLARLQGHKVMAARILEKYAEAAEAAERSGRPMQLNITVEPKSRATKVEVAKVASEDDVLEAALARAEARGADLVAKLFSSDEMVSADAFGALIGASRETVHQKRRRGEVLGLEGSKRGVRFPTWQLVDGHRLLPGLPAVFERFDREPWAVYRFLVQSHPELGGQSGLAALKAGRLQQALEAADSIASGAFA